MFSATQHLKEVVVAHNGDLVPKKYSWPTSNMDLLQNSLTRVLLITIIQSLLAVHVKHALGVVGSGFLV